MGGKFRCDKFGARDLKGARQENTVITYSSKNREYPLIRAEGLYDESETDYLIKASELLRSHDIPTENIVKVYKIYEVVVNGKLVPIEVWRKQSVEDYKARIKPEDGNSVDAIKQVEEFAANAEFYQVERELQVSERVRDLARCRTESEFKDILKTPLNWINTVAKTTGAGIIPGTKPPEYFDIENEDDIKRYLEEWLPSQIGVYLGKLKKAGIKNDFGHAQQWSLAATMYDSQSFVGKQLNGEVLTEQDYISSLCDALGVLEEMFRPDKENYLSSKYADSLNTAKENLLTNYLTEIGFPQDETLGSYTYRNLVQNSFIDGRKNCVRYLDINTYEKTMNNFGFTFSEDKMAATYVQKIDRVNN